MSKYQLYKGRIYLRKGIATLEGAMKKSPDFRAGLGPRLQKVNEQYVLHAQSTGQVLVLTSVRAQSCSRFVRNVPAVKAECNRAPTLEAENTEDYGGYHRECIRDTVSGLER